MKQYCLYTDELGEYSPKTYKKSPLFIITGCIVEANNALKVKHTLDLIKYKYWSNTKITLHSRDIGKKEKDFSIFKGNLSLFNSFTKDLYTIISTSNTSILGVAIDKEKSFHKGWGAEKVVKEAYGAIYKNYIRMLVSKKAIGTLVQEASTPFQDIKIYEKFFEYQSKGLVNENITHQDVKKRLTSISFATKKDSNSLTEIADILGYGLFLNQMISQKRMKNSGLNRYQKMIRKLAKHKLTSVKYTNFKAIEMINP